MVNNIEYQKNIKNHYDRRSHKNSSLTPANWRNEEEIPIICQEICDKIKLTKQDKVLEVGCGNGILGSIMKKKCDYFVGLDISFGMLQKFKEIEDDNTKLNIIQSSADYIPLKDNTFDKIIMVAVTQYLNDELFQKTLTELERITKPDGLVFIGDNVSPSYWLWELNWYLRLPKFFQFFAKIYAKIRRKIAKSFPRIGGKWRFLHNEVSKNSINDYFKHRANIVESDSALYVVRKKMDQGNYKGNKRKDFIIKLNR